MPRTPVIFGYDVTQRAYSIGNFILFFNLFLGRLFFGDPFILLPPLFSILDFGVLGCSERGSSPPLKKGPPEKTTTKMTTTTTFLSSYLEKDVVFSIICLGFRQPPLGSTRSWTPPISLSVSSSSISLDICHLVSKAGDCTTFFFPFKGVRDLSASLPLSSFALDCSHHCRISSSSFFSWRLFTYLTNLRPFRVSVKKNFPRSLISAASLISLPRTHTFMLRISRRSLFGRGFRTRSSVATYSSTLRTISILASGSYCRSSFPRRLSFSLYSASRASHPLLRFDPSLTPGLGEGAQNGPLPPSS